MTALAGTFNIIGQVGHGATKTYTDDVLPDASGISEGHGLLWSCSTQEVQQTRTWHDIMHA